MDIRLKPVETDEELHSAHELMAHVHAGNAPESRRWLYEHSQRYPGFRREHTRIACLGDHVVSALRISTDTILLGESRLKMGGIGWVTTAKEYRGKGLCRRLMEDALDCMRRSNYHVSMLFGIPDFYHRFGYVTALADYSITMDTVEGLKFGSVLRIRSAKPGDIPALQKVHSLSNTGVACSVLRTTAHFKNRWNGWKTWYVLTDEHGKVEAYFIAGAEGERLRVDDVGVADPGLCAAVVGAAARLAADESLGNIRFYVPPPHPLSRYLLQFRSTHEMRVDRNAGGMMAFVNIEETLESLIPEWENLLQQTPVGSLRTEVTLIVDGASFRIRSNRGAVDVSLFPGKNKISLSAGELMHLIAGYRHVEDVVAPKQCVVAPDARRLLATIFPKRCPYVWCFDRF